jgi:hypothetical protein
VNDQRLLTMVGRVWGSWGVCVSDLLNVGACQMVINGLNSGAKVYMAGENCLRRCLCITFVCRTKSHLDHHLWSSTIIASHSS